MCCCMSVGHSRGLYHRARSVLYVNMCSTSSFTRSFSRPIPSWSQYVVCQQVQYKFLHEVILEAYTSRDTRLTLGQLDSEFTTDIDVNKPNKRTDDEFKVWEGHCIVCLHGGAKGLCAPRDQTSSFHTEQSGFFPLSKQINIEINRSLVWHFGAASIITCW